MAVDPEKLAFLRGLLAAFASGGQVVHYEEVRRLCRLNRQQLGEYLGAARGRLLEARQADFCSIVVGDEGLPGPGWQEGEDSVDPLFWSQELANAHRFWKHRRSLDNSEFRSIHGDLPAEPGLAEP